MEAGFYFASNLVYSHCSKIINESQRSILEAVDGNKTIDEIAQELMFSPEDVGKAIGVLRKSRLVKLHGEDEPANNTLMKKEKTINLWLHTTDECTLRCTYCYIPTLGSPRRMEAHTYEAIAEKIVQTVRNNDLDRVALRFSGGEPMVSFGSWLPFCKHLRDRLSDLHCQLSLGVITNLTIMNRTIVEKLKEERISISCSIDGLGRYQDAARRFPDGSGSFETVRRNLDLLLNEEVSPFILIVVSNDNMDGLLDLTRELVELDVRFRYSVAQDNEVDFHKLRNILTSCYEYLERKTKDGYPFSRRHRLCNLKLNGASYRACGAGYGGASIYLDGEVFFCHKLFGSSSELGRIDSENDLYQMIQQPYALNKKCGSCIFKFKCSGGCPLTSEFEDFCTLYKEMIPTLFRIAGQERLYQLKNAKPSGTKVS